MDICYVIFAAICFTPIGLQEAKLERVYGGKMVVNYGEFILQITDEDNIIDMDKSRASRACAGRFCVYYHQFCSEVEGVDFCRYHIQRSDRTESISILAQATGNNLPENWRSKASVIWGSDRSRINSP
ncbi:MAG: hypothetical protein FD128_2758 [Hyphomonadaceae bacterium]|nr:MAG: hypothetical protein FD128_2758 [Hyphomonadaceae bacterium]